MGICKQKIRQKAMEMVLKEEGKSKTSAFFCRICHDDGDLISPCHCTGSVGLIHVTCLERWLSTDGKSACEICKFDYQVVRRFKSFSEWIMHLKTNREGRRYVICDLLSCIVLTPLLIFAFIMCVSGYLYYTQDDDNVSESNSLLTLASLIFLIYGVWMYLLVSHNYREFNLWRNQNQEVKLSIHDEGLV